VGASLSAAELSTKAAANGIASWPVHRASRRVAYQVGTIITAGCAATYAGSLLGPLQETMRTAAALSDNQMALLQGPTLYLPAIAAAIPIGFLIDRFSRSRLLTIFAALQLIGSVLTAWAPTFAVLLVARAIIGLMICATAMDASALLGSIVPAPRRGRAFMTLGIAQIAGISAAFGLGGKLIAYFGPASDGWRWAMVWLSAPLLLVCALTATLPEPDRTEREEFRAPLRAAVKELWQLRGMALTLSVGPVVVAMSYMASLVWAAPIITRRFALPPDRVGAIIGTVVLISGLVGSLLGGVLADLSQRTGGPRRTIWLMTGLALLQIPAGFFGVAKELAGVVLLLALLSTLSNMKGIICATVSTVAIPNHLRGLCFGLQNAVASIFVSLSPVLVSLISARMGGSGQIGTALAIVSFATSILGVVTFILGRGYFPGRNMSIS
jgi:MFS family permease